MSAADATVLAARWLRYARGDLDAASALLESSAGEPRHVAGLAQQAAEKAIKAVLVADQIVFPFTHDLEELHALVPRDWRLAAATVELKRLTPWAVRARYPVAEDADQRDAQEARQRASEVLELVERDFTERALA